ncbi:unnamed protein product [Cylindrotheca closterium]|uniref:Kinesin light chain n=1 Tax=Cylindrotheca closterium TaxID=2856 RepID=A0AAD2CHL5_9STRA|nr:unnamed protein product [Cylindrotheca closterium]
MMINDDQANKKRPAEARADNNKSKRKKKQKATNDNKTMIVISSDSDDDGEKFKNNNDAPQEPLLDSREKIDQWSKAGRLVANGAALYNEEKYDEAMKMHRQVLAIRLRVLGNRHIRVARTYCAMGKILEGQVK